MGKYTQAGRSIELTTPLGKDTLLLEGFRMREAISQLFLLQLDLLAENQQEIAFDKLLGQNVTVRVALEQGKSRYFNGLVNRLSQGIRDKTFTRYQAEIVPQFWLLTKRTQSRIFQHLSVPDILKTVLDGLDVAYEIQGTFHPRDFCVQYRESDGAFASRLMEEEGIYYFFRHTADSHKMVVANMPASHLDLPEESTILFEEVKGDTRVAGRIDQWEKVQTLRSGKYTLWDHCFELPHKHLQASKAIAESVTVGKVSHKLNVGSSSQLEIYEYPGEYAQRFDGIDRGGGDRPAELQKIFEDNKRTVAIRMQQEALPGLVIQGASTCRQFVSGHKFTLTSHFNADGPYLLTSVEHSASLSGGFRSGETPELTYENRFTCIPLELPYRPPRVTPRPRVEGTQTAVVVGPPGEEIFCDKYGRVKVQFHWDRQGQHNADSSCWVRVGSIWAGKRRGVIYIPLVGDEVIVDFLEGDPDRPIIIGSVYNAEMMPPNELPKNKEVSGYKGRTGSNYFHANDTKNDELAKINAEKDFHLIAGNTIYMEVKGAYYKLVAPDIFIEGKERIHLSVGANTIKIEKSGIEVKASLVTIVGDLVKINC